jgi:outer membrane lipoprotein-sorting protein
MLDNQMWTYAPKINRVIKVPSSMMSQSWMGSDFSNKDVSRADDVVDQYKHSIVGEKEHEGHKVYVIEAIPNENSAVVWGKEILEIRDDGVLMLEQFYDQDGVLVKAMETLETGTFDGRTIGTRQRMAKVDSEGEWTEVHYDRLDFGVELEDSLFTQSNLRNPRQ